MSWIFLLPFAAICFITAIWLGKWPDTCPQCHRELFPEDHHGFHPYERRFCRYCPWDEDKV